MGIIGFITAIISSLIFMIYEKIIYMRPIKLKGIAQKLCLFRINIFFSVITLGLLYICDWILIRVSYWQNMEYKNCGLFIWFVEIGGFNLLIATVVSLVYNFILRKKIQAKFIEQHTWIQKAFFTIICILIVIMYVILIYRNGKIYDITSDEWKRAGAWINTVLGMFIGFGTNINEHPLKKIKTKWEIYKHGSKESREQVRLWFASFTIIILTLIIYLITEHYEDYMFAIVIGCIIGVSITAIVVELYLSMYNKENLSKKRLKRLLNNINEGCIVENSFMKVKFSLKRDKERYYLFIYEQKIELDKNIVFPDKYKNKDMKCFEGIRKEYVIEKYNNQVEELLLSIAKNRKNIIKNGWTIIYNNQSLFS